MQRNLCRLAHLSASQYSLMLVSLLLTATGTRSIPLLRNFAFEPSVFASIKPFM
jgi:hypothetical protein